MSKANQSTGKKFVISIVSDKTADEIQSGLDGYLKSLDAEPLSDEVESVQKVYGTDYVSIDQVEAVIKNIDEHITDIDNEETVAAMVYRLTSEGNKFFEDGCGDLEIFLQNLKAFFLIPEHAAAFEAMPYTPKGNLSLYLPALHDFFRKLETSADTQMEITKAQLLSDPYHTTPDELESIKETLQREKELKAFKDQQRGKAA